MQCKFLNFLGMAKRANCVIEGYNNCEENIKNGRIRLLIISTDVSENSKNKFTKFASDSNVYVINDFNKEELGHSIGREEISFIGINNSGFSKKLKFLYESNK